MPISRNARQHQLTITILALLILFFVLVSAQTRAPIVDLSGRRAYRPEVFEAKDLTESVEVSVDEFEKMVREQDASDAIGIASIPKTQLADIPATNLNPEANGPFPISIIPKDKSIRVVIESVSGPGITGLRAVSDGQAFALIVDTCGSGLVQKHDFSGKLLGSIDIVGMHTAKDSLAANVDCFSSHNLNQAKEETVQDEADH